jgi:hypothetical protein
MQTVAATVRLRDWLASARGLAPELHTWHHHKAQSPFSPSVTIAPVWGRNGLREMKSSFVRYLGVYATFPSTRRTTSSGTAYPGFRFDPRLNENSADCAACRYGVSTWRRLADRCFAFRVPHFAIRIPNQFVAIVLPLVERFSPHSNILSASSKIV